MIYFEVAATALIVAGYTMSKYSVSRHLRSTHYAIIQFAWGSISLRRRAPLHRGQYDSCQPTDGMLWFDINSLTPGHTGHAFFFLPFLRFRMAPAVGS